MLLASAAPPRDGVFVAPSFLTPPMSPSAGKIRDHAINAIITVAAAIFITSAVHVYETRADHNADMQRIENKLERVLDVLCQNERAARACATGEVSR